jgi:hypothetical protein
MLNPDGQPTRLFPMLALRQTPCSRYCGSLAMSRGSHTIRLLTSTSWTHTLRLWASKMSCSLLLEQVSPLLMTPKCLLDICNCQRTRMVINWARWDHLRTHQAPQLVSFIVLSQFSLVLFTPHTYPIPHHDQQPPQLWYYL